MLKKNNPFVEGLRKWGLHGPKEAASSSSERTAETPSLGDAVISLIADNKRRLARSTAVPRDSGRH